VPLRSALLSMQFGGSCKAAGAVWERAGARLRFGSCLHDWSYGQAAAWATG
jgi:hypothetical protein